MNLLPLWILCSIGSNNNNHFLVSGSVQENLINGEVELKAVPAELLHNERERETEKEGTAS